MSKVIFLGTPLHGHTYPSLGLINELVNRGEQVIYYSSDYFREAIEKAGAVFRRYKHPELHTELEYTHDAVVHSQRLYDLKHFYGGLEGSMKICSEMVREVLEEVEKDNPAYIIHDSTAHWGKQLARRLQLPSIASITMFAFCDRILELHPRTVLEKLFRIEVNSSDQLHDTLRMLELIPKALTQKYDLTHFKSQDKFLCTGDLNIVYVDERLQPYAELFDDSFKFVGPSFFQRDTCYTRSFGDSTDKPLLYISLGSMVNKLGIYDHFYELCFEAFGEQDLRVVLNVGTEHDLSSMRNVPANFQMTNFVPQLEILKSTDVFISHAGMNSVSESIHFHVPLLLLPQTGDQYYVAERVEHIGAGLCLDLQTLDAAQLRSAVETLLKDPTYRENCKSFRTANSGNGHKEAADEVFRFKQVHSIV